MNPGTRLGPYELRAPIGAGGMGEVWSARDERFGRDVAVKILPPSVTGDEELLKRFEQEARAAGSLNHPNLVTIFDAGSQNGTAYIAMELLEGETLREKLNGSSHIPLRKTLDYSIQIATGLAAAHEKGIVHRDLKPENLFVCKDGRVKILDFGLAKLSAAGGIPEAPTQLIATTPGMVMGTVAYMSPEQVRARPVDHRSDIFSFGAIVFEMVSGRRAFAGDTTADLMSAILHHEPPDLTTIRDDAPPALSGIVRRCLEKSPDERFQSVRDLGFHLQTISGGSATAKSSRLPTKSRSRVLILAAAALAIAIIAVTLVYRAGLRLRRPLPLITATTQLTFLPGPDGSPSIAPDGKTFVFSRGSPQTDLYLQRVDGHNAIDLTKDSADDDWQPAFSPDGSSIVFRSERSGGGLFVMGATGEAVRRISDFGYNPSWSPDGSQIVCSTEPVGMSPRGRGTRSELWIIDVKSGVKRLLTRELSPAQPSWSPHGNRIAFWFVDANAQRDIATIDPSAPKERAVPLTHDAAVDWIPMWAPDGRSIYFGSDRGGTMGLWRIAVDERSGKPQGEPQQIVLPAAFVAHFTIDRSGHQLLFSSLERTDRIRRARIDGSDTITVAGGSMALYSFALSRDGQWVTYTTFDREENVFVAKSDGSESRQITDSPDRKRAPSWTPDGRILFYSNRSGTMQAWIVNSDGTGLTQATDLRYSVWFPAMSPDGKTVLARNEQSSFFFPATPLPARSATLLTDPPIPGCFFEARLWSPDSRFILGAFSRRINNLALPQLILYDTVTRKFDTIAPSAGGAAWMPDGRAVLAIHDHKIWKIDLTTHAQTELPISLDGADNAWLAISPDAKYVYWMQRRYEGDVWHVTLEEK